MTNPEAELIRLKDHLRAMAEQAEKNIPTWWTANGYANILERALGQIRSHEARAVRVYGEAAPLFAACGEKSLTEMFGPLCWRCAKRHINCDCDPDIPLDPPLRAKNL